MKKLLYAIGIIIVILIATCPNEKDLAKRLDYIANSRPNSINRWNQYPLIEYNFFVCKTFTTANRRYLGIFGNFIWLS